MKLIRTVLVVVVLLLTATTAARAADQLADALPQDALVVVRVTGLHDAWNTFADSEMLRKIEQSPIPDLANGIAMARAEIENLEVALGVDVEAYTASIFGSDAALVLFSDKTGAFIAQSNDTATLDQAVSMILDMETHDGKTFGRKDTTHRGVTVTGVQMSGTGDAESGTRGRYHARIGSILAVSETKGVVERVIDVVKKREPSLSRSSEYKQALALMPEGALARVYVDTDRLAEMIDLEEALNGSMQNPGVRLIARRMRNLLPSTRFLAGSLIEQGNSVVCKYSIAYNEAALSENMRAMLPKSNAPLDITRLVPDSALLSCSAQVNKVALWRFILDTLREADPQAAAMFSAQANLVGPAIGGMDFETQLLPQLGDQNAFVVLPGPEGAPPALALIIELNNGQELPTALRTLAGTVAMVNQMESQERNTEPVVAVQNAEYKKTGLMTLKIDQPELHGMLNPTLFTQGRFLVITSTPESARTIIDTASASSQPITPAVGTLVSRTRLNLEEVGRALVQHKDFLIAQTASEWKSHEQARTEIESLIYLVGLFKDVEVQGVHVKGRIDREVRISY